MRQAVGEPISKRPTPTSPTTSGENLGRLGQWVGEISLAAAYSTKLCQGTADCYRNKVWEKDPSAVSTLLSVAQKTAEAFRRRQSGLQENTLAIWWASLGQQTLLRAVVQVSTTLTHPSQTVVGSYPTSPYRRQNRAVQGQTTLPPGEGYLGYLRTRATCESYELHRRTALLRKNA